MKVVALAGGVGGAKLAEGLAHVVAPHDLTIVVNTGDDFQHLGLRISPDLDTVCYTLAGMANPRTGWGRSDETWNAIHAIEQLRGPAWFQLGDKDLATHITRTDKLAQGQSLSAVLRLFCKAWGIQPTILPMSDDPVRTMVQTDEGEYEFQQYFVRQQCRPRVQGFEFRGAEVASPAPGVLEALDDAAAVIICPSNPWVSIGPILALRGIRERLASRQTIAVSPIVGGRALKGPAAKMYSELGIEPSALAVAKHYAGHISGFVLDEIDASLAIAVRQLGVRTLVARTVMHGPRDRQRLARDVLHFAQAD